MLADFMAELTLRSEDERFPEASVKSAFEQEGLPCPTRLLTTDPKVRVFSLPLYHPSEDFIYGIQNALIGTGARIVGTRVTPAPYDLESDVGPQLRIQHLETTDNFECRVEGC